MSFMHTLPFATTGANDNEVQHHALQGHESRRELRRTLELDTNISHVSLPVDCRVCGARARGLCQVSPPGIVPAATKYKLGDRLYRAGESLFNQGENGQYMYNLVRGWVCVYALAEEGRRQILHFALPGAVLGYHPGVATAMNYSAEALTDVVVCIVPLKDVPKLLQTEPAMGDRLAQTLSRHCEIARDHLMAIGRLDATERVARLILELFVRFRAQWPNVRTDEISLPLTQEHIADAVGLTGVHINRVLRELRARNVLEFRYKKLRVLNDAKLQDISQASREVISTWLRGTP